MGEIYSFEVHQAYRAKRSTGNLAKVSGDSRWGGREYATDTSTVHKLRVVRGATEIINFEEQRAKKTEQASTYISDTLLYEQKPELSTVHDQELQELQMLQMEFCRIMGIPYDPNDLLNRSYNPIINKFHVRRFQRVGDIQGLEGLRREIRIDLETNLKERFHARESHGEFAIINGHLYSKDFSERPFVEVIEKGVVYRKNLGSPELEREYAELVGSRKKDRMLSDPNTPVGTTIYTLSPHGLTEGTPYDGWFFDRETLKINEQGERFVERTRFAVDWREEEYRKIAFKLNPSYFDTYDGKTSIDAWYLANPIISNNFIPEISQKGMVPERFQALFTHPDLQRLIRWYETVLYSKNMNWRQLALAFNSILNCADDLEKRMYETNDGRILFRQKKGQKDIATMNLRDFAAAQQSLGTKAVREVSGGGCPLNKGLQTGGLAGSSGMSRGIDMLSNSVGKFGLEIDQYGKLKFNCPACGHENTRPRGGYVDLCQNGECPDPTKVFCGNEEEEDKKVVSFDKKKKEKENTEFSESDNEKKAA